MAQGFLLHQALAATFINKSKILVQFYKCVATCALHALVIQEKENESTVQHSATVHIMVVIAMTVLR